VFLLDPQLELTERAILSNPALEIFYLPFFWMHVQASEPECPCCKPLYPYGSFESFQVAIRLHMKHLPHQMGDLFLMDRFEEACSLFGFDRVMETICANVHRALETHPSLTLWDFVVHATYFAPDDSVDATYRLIRMDPVAALPNHVVAHLTKKTKKKKKRTLKWKLKKKEDKKRKRKKKQRERQEFLQNVGSKKEENCNPAAPMEANLCRFLLEFPSHFFFHIMLSEIVLILVFSFWVEFLKA